jgi:hypothetical protein
MYEVSEMITKFMDGPKAGYTFDLHPRYGSRVNIPYLPEGKRTAVYGMPGPREDYKMATYTIYDYRRLVFKNEHVSIIDTAKLAYSGQRNEHPSGVLPWRREIHPSPIPDFLTDFDAWWRRLLWDQQVIQDRETRLELQELEYAKGMYE